jgi:hypothetical protein
MDILSHTRRFSISAAFIFDERKSSVGRSERGSRVVRAARTAMCKERLSAESHLQHSPRIGDQNL